MILKVHENYLNMNDLIIVIGASGSIGTHLVKTLVQNNWSCVCALHHTPLPSDLAREPRVIQQYGFDILDMHSIDRLFSKFAARTHCIWNLAAPLSVASERDPSYAELVVVEGMKKVLLSMKKFGIKKICFSDSIGSFGSLSPRDECKGSWLSQNPEQDPESVYGRQKRECRNLLTEFSSQVEGSDTRFAVIPGVLHTSPTWGMGTTEYALSAIECASLGKEYTCPVPLKAVLPMIYIDDLTRALVGLMEADKHDLVEADRGYAICGFSFSADQLFDEIKRQYRPKFKYKVVLDNASQLSLRRSGPTL